MDALVLWPPGPQRREANRAAERAFALSGDPTALALPDSLVLAVGLCREENPARLREMWTGLEAIFTCDRAERRGACLYLPVDGELEILGTRAREIVGEGPSLPFEPAIGFYLGGLGNLKAQGEESLPEILEQAFRWHSCRLAILHFEGEAGGLRSFRWKEGASAWRPARQGKRYIRDNGPESR